MNITKSQLSKSQIKLTVEVATEELQPYLNKAAESISAETKIAGFRPGKAPYDVIKTEVGEMNIYQRAIDDVISKTLYQAMSQELKGAEITGQPQINIEKMAPGNPLVYTAVITLVPEVKIGDWQKIKIEKKEAKADPKEIDKVLNNMQRVHAKEVPKTGPLEKGDKAIIKFDGFMDKVAMEGGSHPEYPLVIGEGNFIPGFEEQLIGLGKDEKKEFEIRFPANYHQKSLAGKLALFKVEVKETFGRELPELNDDFAKTLGNYQTLAEIKAGIENNLKEEATGKEAQRQEIAMLDELIKITTFEEIPENLIEAEAHRMVHELEHSIENQGLKFEDYLSHLNKTEEVLQKELMPEGKKRLQTALITRQIAKDKNLVATKEEVEKELEEVKKMYGQNPEVMENLSSAGYKQYLMNVITNRKVIEYLKGEIIK